jgi:hypothetical protein
VTGASGNPGPSGSDTTDQFGQARFCYTNQTTPGNDTITAFADTSNDGVRQSSEPQDTATKTWVRPVTTPGCTITITNGGWIKADNNDKASFGGNAKASASGATSGQEEYQDKGPAANTNVKSTNVLSIQCNSPTDATIFGQATVNGSGSHAYRIDVHDGAANGTKDLYGIIFDTGYNSGEHTLGGGNVNIHK